MHVEECNGLRLLFSLALSLVVGRAFSMSRQQTAVRSENLDDERDQCRSTMAGERGHLSASLLLRTLAHAVYHVPLRLLPPPSLTIAAPPYNVIITLRGQLQTRHFELVFGNLTALRLMKRRCT